MSFLSRFLLVTMLSLSLIGCELSQMPRVVTPDGEEIQVELALTPEQQQQGLMFRESLAADSGMLFVFPEERFLSFWMKDTLIPLDILYIDANRTIVDIQTMAPCKKDPCPNYPSESPAQYALELNAGAANELDLNVGEQLSFYLPTHDQANGQ